MQVSANKILENQKAFVCLSNRFHSSFTTHKKITKNGIKTTRKPRILSKSNKNPQIPTKSIEFDISADFLYKLKRAKKPAAKYCQLFAASVAFVSSGGLWFICRRLWVPRQFINCKSKHSGRNWKTVFTSPFTTVNRLEFESMVESRNDYNFMALNASGWKGDLLFHKIKNRNIFWYFKTLFSIINHQFTKYLFMW